MKGFKNLLTFVVFIAIAAPIMGQSILTQQNYWDNYTIRNYGVDEGIFSPQVYKIHKDKKGFYWIVSNGELLRFDGLTFKDFPKGNIGGTLYGLVEDSEGYKWIPSIGAGLYKFNGDSLKSYMESTGDLTKSVILGNNDTLLVGTYGAGLKVFHKDSVFNKYSTANGLVGDEIWTIEKDRNGKLWIGTNSGISIFDNGNIKNFTTKNGLPYNRIRAIKELENGEVWVGTDKEGIVVFKNEIPVKYIHTKDGLTNLLIQDIEEGENGDIFIATLGGGIVRYNNGVKDILTKNDGLISDEVNTISIDGNNLMLLGTEDGLSVLSQKFFKSLSMNGKDVFNQEAVTLNKDGADRIWLGTYGQGYWVQEQDRWKLLENPPKATNGYAQSGTIDGEGNLWVGTQGAGVFKIENDKFIEKFTTKNGLLDDYVRGLAFDKEGNLWIGSNKGISVYNSLHELIETYSTEEEIPNAFCITLIAASDGSIWYGSYGGGVVRFKDGEKTIYNTNKGLKSDQVLSIYEDSNNDIWIGTFNYGISKVIGDGLYTLGPEDGLPSANYAGIVEDNSNNMWFATGNGITKVSLSSLNEYIDGAILKIPFHYFNYEDGLISDNLQAANNSTLLKLKDGTLLFASIDGVSHINPEKMNFIASSFEPYIDEIIIDAKKIDSQNSFEIKPSDKKLSISFSAINFEAPKKTKFRIQLKGIDENWVYVEDRTTAYYDFLPDGNYTFVVSAIGPDGQWSEKTASIQFVVLPPFYKTWWFLGLCFIGFIGIGAGGVQIRSNIKLNKLNRELEFQQKMHQEKERISRDLHDNVGSQMTNLITGIEISNLYLEKNKKDEAKEILANLDVDARNTMTDLRETIWLLDKEMVNCDSFVEHLKGYFKRQSHYLKGLKTDLIYESEEAFSLNPAHSLNLTRIIQEALNNTKKYAEASIFEVEFNIQEAQLLVTIRDDGKGIDLEKLTLESEGNGIKNMKHRAEDVGGSFRIESNTGNGTTIFLTFPK